AVETFAETNRALASMAAVDGELAARIAALERLEADQTAAIEHILEVISRVEPLERLAAQQTAAIEQAAQEFGDIR
ncbi:MAG: hypothetical protein LAQ30_32680, partial [Acidobacteriia bacterium]|nr:hypothetical protein [Terriglobia bacterium]